MTHMIVHDMVVHDTQLSCHHGTDKLHDKGTNSHGQNAAEASGLLHSFVTCAKQNVYMPRSEQKP